MSVFFLEFSSDLAQSRFPPTRRLCGAFLTVTQVRLRGFNLIVACCHLARATSNLNTNKKFKIISAKHALQNADAMATADL